MEFLVYIYIYMVNDGYILLIYGLYIYIWI